MHPLEQVRCDELLEHPFLRTPPPEPEKPVEPRPRRPRVFKFTPRFPLISKHFYLCWCNHLKQLMTAKHKVNDSPPSLFPEQYLKPRRLDYYGKQLEANMIMNKELLKKINLIQRTGGYTHCWGPEGSSTKNRLMCKKRQRDLNEIRVKNIAQYHRMLVARSEQPTTKALNKMWTDTKHKLILGAQMPFILFKQGSLDKGIKDPAFDAPRLRRAGSTRPKVKMQVYVRRGSKIGAATVELFNDIAPDTCKLFLTLVKGDPRGYSYAGTKIFRIVPELYCRCGDVTLNNGFGCYIPEGEYQAEEAEGFALNHSVPGVLSMVVTPEGEASGQFNIIFKPLPSFDGKHVVFGRIVAGPTQLLERISAVGMPLGTPSSEVIISSIGWVSSRSGRYFEGAQSSINFPKRR